MTNEELVMELEEDISWLEQGCETEREICEHIKQAIKIIIQHKIIEASESSSGYNKNIEMRDLEESFS